MQFSHPPRKPRTEPIIPMINVVFLLLIFFLMTAQFTAPPPFALTPPQSQGGTALTEKITIYASAQGNIAAMGVTGDDVWRAIALAAPTRVALRADAQAPARDIARMVARLSAMGIAEVDLVVAAR